MLEKVSSLPFSILDLPIQSISASLADLSSPPIQPVLNKKPSFYIAAMFSPIWTSSKTIGTPKRPADLPKKEVQESAFTSGVDIGLNLPNNWSIESGFHITSVNKRIQHTRNVNYTDLEERRVDNDNFESEVDLTLGSSSGTIDAAISLSRIASTSIADETEVNLDIVHTQHKEFLDIPVIVKKQIRHNNWEWSIRGGIVNRILLNRTITFNPVSSDDNRFNVRLKGHKRPPKSNGYYAMDYLVGLGLAYHISCLLYTSPSPRDATLSRMPSSA